MGEVKTLAWADQRRERTLGRSYGKEQSLGALKGGGDSK